MAGLSARHGRADSTNSTEEEGMMDRNPAAGIGAAASVAAVAGAAAMRVGPAARRRAVLAAGVLCGAWPAAAQQAGGAFPSRPLRIIVPFSAGGSTDILGRICAQILTERLGQPVVVENITGAGGTIGASRVVEAAPDGYTLLAGTPGSIAINPQLQPRIPYQPLRDLEPVVFVGDSPAVVVVRRDSPLRGLRDLVARARAEPGRLTFASAGIGSFAHLSAELFKWRAGVDLVHVPYRGTAPAATDLIAGRVDTMFENYPSVQAYLAAGEMRALAIAARRRSALLPEVPTAAEEGVPDYESSSWFGLFAPARTPRAAIEAVNGAIAAAIREPALAQRLAGLGVEPVGGTPEAFREYVARRIEETGAIIRTAGITAQ
ncbi:MFS transporter [Caldovatus sediminis]|uniref:MFS transporter n=2 Tax=Caldovatus sediminis TaxID=2041189 RepID=A0A8J3EAM3_9PROT|nr:MFS transporter [Caldovatus sediminis]